MECGHLSPDIQIPSNNSTQIYNLQLIVSLVGHITKSTEWLLGSTIYNYYYLIYVTCEQVIDI
jgi:hypothetical protein